VSQVRRLANAFEPNGPSRIPMRAQGEEMKCPKCGRPDLRETPQGVTCRVCGYALSPGENDRYRLYKMLREEEKKGKRK
jgi:ribosomal protein L37AE/L43A